jgi:NAD(P)-dependent dehydrogenase (short-subunit alcohol dehydrogenase family)
VVGASAVKALALVRDDGTAVAIPQALEQVRDDAQQAAARLGRGDVGGTTRGILADMVTGLEELLAALEKAQRDRQEQEKQARSFGGSPPQPGDQPLVDALAELKMIRSLQLRVNGRLGTTAVTVQSGGTLGGSGVLGGNLTGDGLIAPGNSPGILTVEGQLTPTGSTSFAFEFSGTGSPVWGSASASVNDVLRLTNSDPFTSSLTSGNIVNICSIMGSGANEMNIIAYTAAKGALRNITQQLGCEWADRGVRVNAVSPGFIITEMTRAALEGMGMDKWIASRTPMRRVGELEEIVGPVMFLCSDLSRNVTGTTMYVDAGYHAMGA